MFKIRREQKAAFARDAVSHFEDRAVVHLRLFFPEAVGALDEAAMRARIRDGIERAAAHGIVAERGVAAYIDVMFLHGDDFDTDRRCSWAAAILHDRSIRSPVERADRLLAVAISEAKSRSSQPSMKGSGPVARARAIVPAPSVRRVAVEVRFGARTSRKAVLEPGRTLRVGRSSLVELAFPRDARMSTEHLSLSWDGEVCRVRDLASAEGTWLQGQRVVDAEVASGAWIRAGDTDLMVYVEARSPPGPAGPVPTPVATEALHALSLAGPLFAVVDASQGARPLQLLREAVDEHRSLYEGTQGDALALRAPYLVAIRADSGLLERLVREGWGAGWGMYFSSARSFKDVRRHLRRFLLVEDDETGERYYFRFYDPRTLRVLLPTCTPRQRGDFFGDIACFFAEGERGEVCRFPQEPSP